MILQREVDQVASHSNRPVECFYFMQADSSNKKSHNIFFTSLQNKIISIPVHI